MARVRVAQTMEVRLGLDPGALAGLFHWPGLMRRLPFVAALLRQKNGIGWPPGRLCGEERHAFVCEDDMAPLPAFAGPNMQRSAVRVEIADLKPCEFAIPRACGECGAHEQPEVRG